jgi:hypothetical protein
MHERYEGQWNDLFLKCDDHWSRFGHDAATAILKEKLGHREFSATRPCWSIGIGGLR